MIKKTSLAGSRTVSNTITIVTRPACGIPAAPILAAVAVILEHVLDATVRLNRNKPFLARDE